MRRSVVSVIFGLTALAVLGAGWAIGGESPTAARPIVGFWGAHSSIQERTYGRITTAADWTALWLRHVGKDPTAQSDFYNESAVPEIDFDRCMVVAVTQGRRTNSAGVAIVSIDEQDDLLRVRFDDRSFQTASSGPDGGAQKVTPFGFFVLPRSTKALVLEEDVQRLLGRPPEWKERARFPAIEGK